METTNARCSVIYVTMSVAGTPQKTRREAVDAFVRSCGGHVTWRCDPNADRAYALLEFPDGYGGPPPAAQPGETVYETAIIAVAVSPNEPEALPYLRDALAGEGRPAGILACRTFAESLVVEWDPRVCAAHVVSRLIGVELRRFHSAARTVLLAPLPPGVLAKIAADGLAAPEIMDDRILESLIQR